MQKFAGPSMFVTLIPHHPSMIALLIISWKYPSWSFGWLAYQSLIPHANQVAFLRTYLLTENELV